MYTCKPSKPSSRQFHLEAVYLIRLPLISLGEALHTAQETLQMQNASEQRSVEVLMAAAKFAVTSVLEVCGLCA